MTINNDEVAKSRLQKLRAIRMLSSPSRSVEDETDQMLIAAAKLKLNNNNNNNNNINNFQTKKREFSEKKAKKNKKNKKKKKTMKKRFSNDEYSSDTSSDCDTTELDEATDDQDEEGEALGSAYDFYELLEGNNNKNIKQQQLPQLSLSKYALESLFGSSGARIIKRSKSLDNSLDKISRQIFASKDDSELYMLDNKATLTGS
jgi:hypothetical protein